MLVARVVAANATALSEKEAVALAEELADFFPPVQWGLLVPLWEWWKPPVEKTPVPVGLAETAVPDG